MFRKTILALAAVATLGLAATAPTAASAKHWGWHGWHGHHHFHKGYWGPTFVMGGGYYGGCYYVKRWIATPVGMKLRRVLVCS
jgi:hypothetical protein